MSESTEEEATIEEMLDISIRFRPESRSQVIRLLDDFLIALNRGNPPPNAQDNHDLWLLYRDGRMVRYSNS